MSDLADFLMARIAEDEAYAKLAADTYLESPQVDPSKVPREELPLVALNARWHPHRVAAECAAKRKIVQTLAALMTEADTMTPQDAGWQKVQGAAVLGSAVLGVMATPYSGHRDFNRDWTAVAAKG